MYYYGPMGMGFFGWGGMTLFWILFIVVMVWLLRQNRPAAHRTAMQMARERYASGEISKKEYAEIIDELQKGEVRRAAH